MIDKFLRKSARRAQSAAGRAAKRQLRRAAPSFLTPKSWDAPKTKKAKSKKTKTKEPKRKSQSWGSLLNTKSDSQFWGRALGLAYSRLKGSRSGSPVVLLVEPPTSQKNTSSSKMKAPMRRRKKGERTLTDPRFERTQAKYEARKTLQKEAKFIRDNDYLFNVSLPGGPAAAPKSLLLTKNVVASLMGSRFTKFPRLNSSSTRQEKYAAIDNQRRLSRMSTND